MSTLLPLATVSDAGAVKPRQGSGVVVDASGVVSLSYDSLLKLDLRGNSDASATGSAAVAIGSGAQATDDRSVAIGSGAQATHAQSFAIGSSAQAINSRSVAIGSGAQATNDQSIAIGSGAQAKYDRSVAIGAGASTVEADSFSVGTYPSSLRRIKGVQDGVADTDATTLRQVRQMIHDSLPGPGGLYLSGTIAGTLTQSQKPLLAWVVPRSFTLTPSLIKANSMQTPNGGMLVLNLMYRGPNQQGQGLGIALISYFNSWSVTMSSPQVSVLEGGMLSVIDTAMGDPGFLTIGITIPAS